MLDLVILNLPGCISQLPPAAPALLKASVERHGFTCRTIDFNIRLQNSVLPNLDEINSYFITGLNNEYLDQAVDIINKYVDEVIQLNPTFVGISVFTYQNRIATKLFCEEIKKKSNVKIILGGQGLADGGIMGPQNFAQDLVDKKLADYYIKSEGEYSLVQLLKGNFSYPGINSDSFQQITNLDELPIPDYTDYEFHLYKEIYLPITASRGCVRSCSFCDIHNHWKYQFRTGEAVAHEIISLYKKHGIKNFYFTDSLINGSLREFKIFCKILADFNKSTQADITYSGQYIVRASNQLNEEYWKNLSLSGARSLAVGVETGSDRVRAHMNKKFTNADLDYTMAMFEKYNITCIFLLIFGYPTETDEDFQETLRMLEKYKYLANKIIIDITFGSTLGILPGTPLYNNASLYHIELDRHENNWVAIENPTLTLEERIRRREVAKDHAISLGYKLSIDGSSHILSILKKNIQTFNKRNQIKKLIKIKAA